MVVGGCCCLWWVVGLGIEVFCHQSKEVDVDFFHHPNHTDHPCLLSVRPHVHDCILLNNFTLVKNLLGPRDGVVVHGGGGSLGGWGLKFFVTKAKEVDVDFSTTPTILTIHSGGVAVSCSKRLWGLIFSHKCLSGFVGIYG